MTNVLGSKALDRAAEELAERAEREKQMTGYTLTTESKLDIQLSSIEYPANENSATVVFEIHATRVSSGEYDQRIALLRYDVPVNGKSKSDYVQLVRTAANGLRKDLVTMQGSVSTRYLNRLTR
ncbi:MAG: hypothetical protein OXT72_15585 [Gammaproteobacteria bacterium]|nr:hypothetical protein [Gammaproteobacteria bacterium]MDE0248223.1 hypothetical protein [Gammaproteobacteria bacterium]